MKKFLNKFSIFIGGLVKANLILLVLLLVLPFVYFAWRAGQPMSMPEYGGRTYYELLVERQQAYTDLALTYQKSHLNVDVKEGLCFQTELAVSILNLFPWAGICAASEFSPPLRIYGPNSERMGCGHMGGTWTNFLVTWWNTYEVLLYKDIFSSRSQSPVPYCRIKSP